MKSKINTRQRSKTRIRQNIVGTAEKPRLTVYRSLNHVYTQLVDDSTGNTLTSASTLSKEIEKDLKNAQGK